MRRQARELALQILFQLEFSPRTLVAELLHLIGEDIPRDVVNYAEALVEGVKTNKEKVDGGIQSSSSHWKLERMATVDRNILRIAVYEMLFAVPPVDAGVAINEAIEVAKIYGTSESASFINGLLDQVA